jgi:methanethiol S-methyltransferase
MDHFDLFGLCQVYLYASGRPYTLVGFRVPGFYRYARHPIMLGFSLAFWATPTMTLGHLLFAVATTVYILIALHFEGRDLVTLHGDHYRAYRKQVGMLFPLRRFPQSSPRARVWFTLSYQGTEALTVTYPPGKRPSMCAT